MDNDTFCIKMLQSQNQKEALSWLHEAKTISDRTIGEMDTQESLYIITDLYSLGAEDIIAVEISPTSWGGETTDLVVLKLPEDRKKREVLFHWEKSHAEKNGFDAVKDEGQSFMFINWD